MPEQHHHLSLVPVRVTSALRRLSKLIWVDPQPLQVLGSQPSPSPLSLDQARQVPLSPVPPGSHWGRLFDQRWYSIPETETLANRWLHWDEQSEATLYLDGSPYFGFDLAHRYCQIPSRFEEIWIESNCLQSAIWHPDQVPMTPEGARFREARSVKRDEKAWQAYHDLACLTDLMLTWRRLENPTLTRLPPLVGLQSKVESYPPEYRQLLRLLDQALNRWETSNLDGLIEVLQIAYKHLRTEKSFLTCTLTGHAHIDLVWLWPERIGELKAVHTFATLNRLLETYPELRFAYSQPASYEAVARRAPDLLTSVRDRIAAGSWQATGALYVESDTNLPCGEALARSFEIGQDCFREIAGHPSRTVWLPDVFGYAACLPQLMKLFNIESFFTTKMTWNALNRFPHSSFRWRSHDGSEVLAHVTQDFGYNCTVEAEEIRKAAYGHQQSDLHHEFLMPTGYGDGGGGVTAEMCERARRLDRLASLPQLKWDQPEAFFERMAPLRDSLPIHEGECYLEYHRGTFTTHRRVKELFRATERCLQMAESVSFATGVDLQLTPAWKRLIFSQFHDYIPGSSVWDVYAEGETEFAALIKNLEEATVSVLEKIPGQPALFNPLPRPVQVFLPERASLAELPPLSGIHREQLALRPVPPVSLDEKNRSADNGLTSFQLNSDGSLKSLLWNNLPAAIEENFGSLTIAPDRASNFEAWDIDRHVSCLARVCQSNCQIEPFTRPDGASGFAVSRPIGNQSRAVSHFYLTPGSPLLHLEIELDWQDPETLLKLHLPTSYRARTARFGAPFGSVRRSQIPDGPVSEAQWEVPFSRWLAIGDELETEGLCLVSESSYGVSVRDGVIGVSLVRSPRITGQEQHDLAWPPELSRLENPPVFSDLGAHHLHFVLGSHKAHLPLAQQAAALADAAFTKPIPYSGPEFQPPFEIESITPNVVPCWAKPSHKNAPGGLLRLHETAGCVGKIILRFADGWQGAPSDFLGNQTTQLAPAITLNLTPHQIATVKVTKSQS
ncbi:MAG: alpha-mannosidase [Puniceicoccaceae bacterium]